MLKKQIPRPPKKFEYDIYTKRMLQGKCSLKELLKSAASRP